MGAEKGQWSIVQNSLAGKSIQKCIRQVRSNTLYAITMCQIDRIEA